MTHDDIKNHLTGKYAGKATLQETEHEPLILIEAENLLEVAKALHEDEKFLFDFLNSIAVADTGEAFEVFYSLSSVEHSTRLDFKVILPRQKASIESVQTIWPSANWYERELWELYGIDIKNHDDLGCFLLPEDWEDGFPMLKDWQGPADFIPFPELEK